ncbi:bifunctional nicotinamide mononucleotide adenylyltransferase/ADP-ribose pyrophosphatase-like protein [Salicola phage SCTP-2]|nr:bifunctional nicotinamide mononucleotide adenylyltransferase/ADP-ribose pyrophosphatase-like protein [Salicola phage SCTP-2]
MSNFKIGVIIGRFQPLHNSHEKLIQHALEHSDYVIILVGSANRAPDSNNPYSYQVRKEFIENMMHEYEISHGRFSVYPLNDYKYNDASWLTQIHSIVSTVERTYNKYTNTEISLYGHHKDNSTYYMNSFPTYSIVDVGNIDNVSATQVREYLYNREYDKARSLVPDYVYNRVYYDAKGRYTPESEEFDRLRQEHFYIQHYKDAWKDAPYEPIFTTTDSVVYFKGYILLVKRKSHPGKGQWCLPGGFVKPEEWIKDSIITNLKKDTNIKVGAPILRSNIREMEVFDDPGRSLRGRIITHCGLIVLDGVSSMSELPSVKSQSKGDVHAQWFPISDVESMSNELFEDHYFIIKQMLKINN